MSPFEAALETEQLRLTCRTGWNVSSKWSELARRQRICKASLWIPMVGRMALEEEASEEQAVEAATTAVTIMTWMAVPTQTCGRALTPFNLPCWSTEAYRLWSPASKVTCICKRKFCFPMTLPPFLEYVFLSCVCFRLISFFPFYLKQQQIVLRKRLINKMDKVSLYFLLFSSSCPKIAYTETRSLN